MARRYIAGLLLAFRLGVLVFCSLMLLGFAGALLEGSAVPTWLQLPLSWAAWAATFAGSAVAHCFGHDSPEPAWLFVARATLYLGSCVFAWTLIAWLGLWLYRWTASRAQK